MIDLGAALRVYLVADPDQCNGELLPAVDAAISGGVTCVQLRAKHRTDRELVELGRALRELTARHEVPLLVNDRVDIALAVDADGVHLGVSDLAPSDARGIAPPGFVIGYSPDNATDLAGSAADYLGIGPVYGTASKADAGAALGLEVFARRVAEATVPVVGIGGITSANAADVVSAGASGVAVISAVLRSPDPAAAARMLQRAVSGAR